MEAEIQPFANEEDSFRIDQLTVENRLDRVQIYGSVELTRDRRGLERAKRLRALLNRVVEALESEELPERVTVAAPGTVKNPFA